MPERRGTSRVRAVLVWTDLEMTGLDPARDRIVEIATLVTDDELEVLAEGPDLVIATAPEALAAMDDVVRQMHTRSGLLDAIGASTISLAQAADETLEFVRKHVPEARKVPLCGNSIGTMTSPKASRLKAWFCLYLPPLLPITVMGAFRIGELSTVA